MTAKSKKQEWQAKEEEIRLLKLKLHSLGDEAYKLMKEWNALSEKEEQFNTVPPS